MERAAFLVILSLLCCCSALVSCSGVSADMVQSECLTVPASEFAGTLKSTIDTVTQVTSVVSKFTNFFGDFRLSHAVNDCLDLLDLSSDNLDRTLAASQAPLGKSNNTVKLSSDLRTWLSGALANQETCLEGFEGTNGMIKNMVGGSLNQVSSLVLDILRMVNPVPVSKGGSDGGGHIGGRKLIGRDEFPAWLTRKDRRLLQATGFQPNAVVALDGTGDFTSLNDAIASVPDKSSNRFIIHIKKGVYREYVEISKKKWNVMLIGDGIDATVISGNHSFIDGWTTYRSATFGVKGPGFLARDLTFENTAGPQKHQAVAYRSDADYSVIFRCAVRGYQDTLYAHSMRQFYRDCIITGTVDFIFGDGTVVFQNCTILARKGLPNQKNTITAQGRKDANEPTGFSIQFSTISAEADAVNSTETYLGRPWKLYSRTVIMQSYIAGAVKPRGWLEWNGDFALNSLYYAEYQNYGPGAGVDGRVKWPGYRVLNDTAVANNFTVAQFIVGNSWLPMTGVKYTAGLSV